MNDIQACCICLVTDVKLYNMCTNNLQGAYETLTGLEVSEPESQYTCSYCGLMLRKFEAFKIQSIESYNYSMGLMTSSEYFASQPIDKIWAPYERTKLVVYSYDETSEEIKKEEEMEFNYETIDNDFDEEYLDETDDIKIETFVDPEVVGDEFDENTELVMLTKEQQIQEVLTRKESYNYRNAIYKCDKCFKGFLTETTFSNHMTSHDPEISGNAICEICHVCWQNKRSLYTHLLKTHQRQYRCKLCDKITKTGAAAKEHLKYHTGFSYTCKLCDAKFSVKTSYFTHLRLQHPSKYSCDQCGESFVSDRGLRMHKRRIHRAKEIQNIEKETSTCSVCEIDFSSREALNVHNETTNHDDENLCIRACVICGHNFPTDRSLREHIKTHQVSERAVCTECNKTFVNEYAFAAHYQRVHLRLKKNYKPKPPKNSDLNLRFVCEQCGRKFSSWFSLITHQRTHSGEKPFQCPECNKRFSVQQRLQIHMRVHTGEKPFQCAICPKAFPQKAALNRHDRVHSGVRPYQCPHCTKAFTQSNSMKMHVNTVHLKLPCPYKKRLKNV